LNFRFWILDFGLGAAAPVDFLEFGCWICQATRGLVEEFSAKADFGIFDFRFSILDWALPRRWIFWNLVVGFVRPLADS
jgi:hypothetical protein